MDASEYPPRVPDEPTAADEINRKIRLRRAAASKPPIVLRDPPPKQRPRDHATVLADRREYKKALKEYLRLCRLSEIVNCPFCGGVDVGFCDAGDEYGNGWIQCGKCGATGPGGKSEEDAIKKWNWRSLKIRLCAEKPTPPEKPKE